MAVGVAQVRSHQTHLRVPRRECGLRHTGTPVDASNDTYIGGGEGRIGGRIAAGLVARSSRLVRVILRA